MTISSMTYRSPTCVRTTLPPGFLDGLVQPVIAHHRGGERVVGEPALAQELPRGDGHDLVAVHEFAFLVAEQDAVGVAVVGDADLRAGLADEKLDFLREACCRNRG